MNQKDNQLNCDEQLGICGLSPEESATLEPKTSKKLELYVFVDPLCPDCWAFEPTLKKLMLEYSHYFSMRFFVAAHLDAWNTSDKNESTTHKNMAERYEQTAANTGMPCDGDVWLENPVNSPYAPSIAVKAAEMQGRQLGTVFFRRLREMLFLDKRNIADESVLIECADLVGLDVEEFKKDIHSDCAINALQCDVKTTKEMEVDSTPTFLFFNDCVEDGGVKVPGLYSFDVYVEIMKEMLGETPVPKERISLEAFMDQHKLAATKEVAVVYDWSERTAKAKLNELALQQKIEQVPVKHGTFWRVIRSS
ncbi:ClpXP adapter SpxH family protein [Salibacterium qingdaonense]|uniref:ClpXP adapter protein SpxH n=1 Tax=Salibacterium qingdaonense TaxID=266892 RepID=A0A1I4IJ48_9BACI|nr:ClpXP adapter SpxH family protein [Salibacterium qingdaonense]SFL54314.1 Predicted dithiol-disulfide isomerase, DsbA family [Salibacterium qingdaonense]